MLPFHTGLIMPQLLFQFQRNGSTNDGPLLESLVHILSQSNIKYDGIQKTNDAVSVDFSSPEEAKKAYKTLDGMFLYVRGEFFFS